jgi:hypothetical protein
MGKEHGCSILTFSKGLSHAIVDAFSTRQRKMLNFANALGCENKGLGKKKVPILSCFRHMASFSVSNLGMCRS